MLPPGRRRLTPLFLTFLLYFTTLTAAASAVIGIDLGTEYIKAALVKPGIPLEIVLSKDSKRKEASAVAFKPPRGGVKEGSFPERSYGGDALALAARFPGEVFPNLKQLLGVSFDGKGVKEYERKYPALSVVESVPRGTVAFKSQAFHGEEKPFSVEELLAMELKEVKENAQLLAGKAHKVANAVFTIPAFFTAEERKALEVAAELAGLNILGMVSDGMAVGLHYATSRTFPSVTEGGKPEYHLVFDMGAGSTVATVLRMQGKTVKDIGRFNKTVQEVTVVGSGWDRTLGGDALNLVIVDDMITKFLETPPAKKLGKSEDDVRAHGRAMARLFKDAEKLRQVLSANKQTTASFEDLYEEVDFRYKLSRDEFEQSTTEFAGRMDAPIKAALKAANLAFDDITSVILHGGATRAPFVQAKLEKLVGDNAKLRSNVNADEAAVFGAAFRAAQISPSFRVKDIVAGDAASYATFLQWTVEGKSKTQKLFTPTSSIGITKQVPFKQLEDFSFKLYQARGASEESSTSAPATYTYQTKNLTAGVQQLIEKSGCVRENITNTLYFRLNPINGLPEVVKGSLSCVVEETPEKKGVLDDVKGWFGGKKDQQPLKDGEESSSSSSTSTASSESGKSTASAKNSKKSKKDKEPAKPKQRTEIVNIELSVSCEGCKDIPAEELSRMKQRLKAFDASDNARRSREEDMNNLEAFIYKGRNILEESDFITYSSKAERSTLEKLINEASEWMYGEGQQASSDVLRAKLKSMTDIVDPVQKRQKEAGLRPAAVKRLEESLNQTSLFVDIIKNSLEEAERMSSSAAVEAASKSSACSSSTTTSATVSPSDPLDELEELITDSSSTSTEEPAPTATPKLETMFSQYTTDDLKDIETLFTEAKTFLTERVQKQERLGTTDDPAFEARELETKAKTLSEQVMRIFERKMKYSPPPPPKKSKKAEKKKAAKTKEAEETVVFEVPKESETSPPPEHGEL